MRKPNGWKKRWADAKAAGPEAVAELSAELRFVMASAERRRQEEARKHLESLGNCTDCGARLNSTRRKRCPICAVRKRP